MKHSLDDSLAEQTLRDFADAIPHLAWMAHADGSIAWFNRQWYEFTGASPNHAADEIWRKPHHPDHADRAVAGYRCALAIGQQWEDTFPLRDAEGGYRWFLTRVVPMRDRAGDIECWFGTHTDVDAQIEAEQKLRESEARFFALVDASPLGIDVMDMNGHPIFFNPKCEELHGISLDQASCEGWALAVHPEDRRRVIVSWRNSSKASQPWAETYRFLHPDGRVVWVSGRAAPMHVDGKQVGYVGALEDITELKNAEFEREHLLKLEQNARQRAERAIQVRDEALAFVAHDLRNPLQTLAVLAKRLAKTRPSVWEDPKSEPQIMLQTVQTMSTLIQDLLDISTMESGVFAITSDSVDIEAILRESVELFETSAQEKGIALSYNAPEIMPPALGDSARLVQVLSNLVGNAIKFTPAGGEVGVEAQLHRDCIHVCVRDTGSGIPPESLPHIFDRFWQARRASRAGAGLGLAIAKCIVDAHGGRIWADSTLGRGTTMSFSVPVAGADA